MRAALAALAQAEAQAQAARRDREQADAAWPRCARRRRWRARCLQRLAVQRQTLAAEAERAEAQLRSLRARLAQLEQDMTRETALNDDAEGTIAQLAG